MTEVSVVPCEFRKAIFKNDRTCGYWVTLWQLITCEHGTLVTHSFLSQADMVDNCNLVDDLDIDYTVSRTEVLVTPTHMSEIFDDIEAYVLKSRSN